MIIPMLGMVTLLLFILFSGILILFLHAVWKVDLINMIFFVAGGFLTAIGMDAVMAYLASRKSATVHPGSMAMIFMTIILAAGIVAGGFYSVSAWHRIVRRKIDTEK